MELPKVRISAVSYLNTKPLLYGLFTHPVINLIELGLDVPSECARKLSAGEVDLALLPVGALRDFEQYNVISDYCIGADGKVRTVCIYSQVPIEAITDIYLDTDSRTSVLLSKYLIKNFWQLDVRYHQSFPGYEAKISGTSAGLMIGDKALDQELKSAYVYDLAEYWKLMHQLPFTFAVWVSTQVLSPVFVNSFNAAMKQGLERIDQLVMLMENTRAHFDVYSYYKENISYLLDQEKIESLRLFLDKTTEIN